jgi:protoporphyrin/coproporphyrin ferrochelatase
MSAAGKTAVLLLAHGSPDSVADIPEFLRNVTSGRPIPSQVVEEITHRYAMIGRSPLREITLQQGELLAAELKLPVYVGMRNWTPYIPDVVAQMTSDGIAQAVAICLAPQNSRTSVGLYRRALFGDGLALSAEPTYPSMGRDPKFDIGFVESWHDHPLLVQAFAERLLETWRAASAEYGREVPVIFTAHSVPSRTIAEGDPYEAQAQQTAELVAKSAQLDIGWQFAFQSQGMSGGPWLGPTVESAILALKGAGHSGVFIQPIGFLCDHVEILYDIDIAFRDFARQNGMNLSRAQSLNASPVLIRALADLARSQLGSHAINQVQVQGTQC